MTNLWAKKDYETIAFWWKILEYVSKWEKPEKRGSVTISWALLKRDLGWNRQRSTKVLLKIAQSFKIEVKPIFDESVELFIPNWLDLQETRGSKTGLKKVEKPDRAKKQEVRAKNLELDIAPGLKTPVAQIRDEFLKSYQNEFGKEYVGWGKTQNGQASRWLGSVSLEKALEFCRIYPKWNDAWVSRNGHPFGVLVSQYVQLDAWVNRPDSIIKKMAKGRVAEREHKIQTERYENLEEMKSYERNNRGLQERLRAEALAYDVDLRASGANGAQVSFDAQKRVPEGSSEFHGGEADPFSETGYDGP